MNQVQNGIAPPSGPSDGPGRSGSGGGGGFDRWIGVAIFRGSDCLLFAWFSRCSTRATIVCMTKSGPAVRRRLI